MLKGIICILAQNLNQSQRQNERGGATRSQGPVTDPFHPKISTPAESGSVSYSFLHLDPTDSGLNTTTPSKTHALAQWEWAKVIKHTNDAEGNTANTRTNGKWDCILRPKNRYYILRHVVISDFGDFIVIPILLMLRDNLIPTNHGNHVFLYNDHKLRGTQRIQTGNKVNENVNYL